MNSQPISRKPPINGSFPLDHTGKCKEMMLDYIRCLQQNNEAQTPCEPMIKRYLECRKESGLLNENDDKILGIE